MGGVEHRFAVRLLYGVDPLNAGIMGGTAQTIAAIMSNVFPNTHSMARWETYDNNNSALSGGNLPTVVTGSHGTNSGMQPYKSAYIQFTGKGIAAAPGYAVGQTRLGWRSLNSYTILAGSKRQLLDTPLDSLRVFLSGSVYVWADFFGQKALVRGTPTVQFNAHIQRVEGS